MRRHRTPPSSDLFYQPLYVIGADFLDGAIPEGRVYVLLQPAPGVVLPAFRAALGARGVPIFAEGGQRVLSRHLRGRQAILLALRWTLTLGNRPSGLRQFLASVP